MDAWIAVIGTLGGVGAGGAITWWLDRTRREAEDRRRLQDLKLDLFASFMESGDELMLKGGILSTLGSEDTDPAYAADLRGRSPDTDRILDLVNRRLDEYNRLSLITDERVALVVWLNLVNVESAFMALMRHGPPALLEGLPHRDMIRENARPDHDFAYHRRTHRRLRAALRSAARHELSGSKKVFDHEAALGMDEEGWPGTFAAVWMERQIE